MPKFLFQPLNSIDLQLRPDEGNEGWAKVSGAIVGSIICGLAGLLAGELLAGSSLCCALCVYLAQDLCRP